LYFAGSAMFNVNGGGNNVQLDARTASGPQLQVMCCTQLATNTRPRGPRSWQGVGRQQVIRMLANKGVPKKRRDDHLVLSKRLICEPLRDSAVWSSWRVNLPVLRVASITKRPTWQPSRGGQPWGVLLAAEDPCDAQDLRRTLSHTAGASEHVRHRDAALGQHAREFVNTCPQHDGVRQKFSQQFVGCADAHLCSQISKVTMVTWACTSRV
jgi:hypothetical protein